MCLSVANTENFISLFVFKTNQLLLHISLLVIVVIVIESSKKRQNHVELTFRFTNSDFFKTAKKLPFRDMNSKIYNKSQKYQQFVVRVYQLIMLVTWDRTPLQLSFMLLGPFCFGKCHFYLLFSIGSVDFAREVEFFQISATCYSDLLK
jgi:hypothetical protein